MAVIFGSPPAKIPKNESFLAIFDVSIFDPPKIAQKWPFLGHFWGRPIPKSTKPGAFSPGPKMTTFGQKRALALYFLNF